MKQHFSRSLICLILVLLLAAAGLQGCASKTPETTAPATATAASETTTVAAEPSSLAEETPTELGEGAKSFTLKSLTLTARRSITPCIPMPRRSARRSSRSV